MASHKLHIACIVTLAMLGLGQHVEAASLKLTWNHSPSTNVAGYLVSYGTQSGKYSTMVKAGYVTSVSITGLTEGTTYYFVVQSYDKGGTNGPPSPEVSGRVSAPTLAISCPSPVLTSPDGNPMSVTLTPTVTGGVTPISTSCSPKSGSLFAVGTTSFTCNAVDATSQKASCSSTVVVSAPSQPAPAPAPAPEPAPVPEPAPAPEPESEPEPEPSFGSQPNPALPTLTCPVIAPVTEAGQSGKEKVVFPDPVFSDGTVPVTVSCAPKSGSLFPLGNTTVSCRATNAAGVSGACTTTVTVRDRRSFRNGS
jgi:Fibronectin type III domain/HYR domain